MKFTLLWTAILLPSLCLAQKPASQTYDVVVYEATPGGIAAAITAARLGDSVALIETHDHVGGMMTSGLGKSDVETKDAIGGLFLEFTQKVRRFYVTKYGADSDNVKLSKNGYYYEPSVAEKVFDDMIAAEPGIHLFKLRRIQDAIRTGNRLTAIRVEHLPDRVIEELHGGVFIDASYEGDLAAFAGVEYRTGREARSETNELHAGVVYMDYETRTFLSGTTGEGDKRLPAYTYRLCLTDDPANSHVLTSPPEGYDRTKYMGYIADWKAGRMGPPKVMKEGVGYFGPTFNTVVRALSIAEIPNHKFDVNINPRPLGFPFAEENYGYPDAGWAERDSIALKLRNLTLGLLYFLQNDPDIPEPQRQLARKYNLAKDEFTDNQSFPWQLYVREARRIVGMTTLTEQDLLVGPELGRTRVHSDSISAGEYPIDSFPVRKHEQGHEVALEGYILMLDELTHPYQIPYGVIVPKTLDGLLVPVAASTTHVAFATIRLEPTWMALGQAAGTAADLSLRSHRPVQNIDLGVLQRRLIAQGQLLTYFKDIDRHDPAYAALQYFGTKSFFSDYFARSKDLLDRGTARRWWRLAFPGAGDVFPDGNDASSDTKPIKRGDVLGALKARGIHPANVTTGDDLLTRGEFCRLLFDSTSM
ncbi:MAG TPA: FAD-dependent oxidoreductase [Acidobacteriaceae bacterium]